MIEVLVTEEKRLDQIVYETDGSLERFEEILSLNKELSHKKILDIGDVVYLPKKLKEKNIIEEKALWS